MFQENGRKGVSLSIKSKDMINKGISVEVEELQKKIRFQEDFLLNISHDLRNPLNVILSVLQCMKYVENDATEKREEYLSIIKRNSLKMVKLINNLIDTTKMEREYFTLKKQNLDIVSFIEGAIVSIDKYAEQKNIQLIFDSNKEKCITAFDPEAMDRIILNLLSNAIKFSDLGGNVWINIYSNDEFVNISVRDNGPGISKEDQEYVFNRFVQTSNSKNSEQSGSGIGLDLVRYLVKLHDGNIKLISDEGVGSEFIITLPIKIDSNIESENRLLPNRRIEQLEIEFSDIYL